MRKFLSHSIALLALLATTSLAAAPARANAVPSVRANTAPSQISGITPQSSQWCSCVVYVQFAKTGYTGVQYAYQLNSWLPNHGWWKDRGGNTPGWGDVMVFQPGAYYADGTAGHTAIVQTSSQNSNGSWSVTMKSADWSVGGNWFTDAGCYNVRYTTFTYYGDSGITFWRKW